MKEITWVGSSKGRLSQFPKAARQEGGRQLRRVQQGLQPKDWKSMPDVGPGVIEIRIHEPHEHRIFYVVAFSEGIYVLHAFEKKTQQARRHDLNIGRRNYAYIKKGRKNARKINRQA